MQKIITLISITSILIAAAFAWWFLWPVYQAKEHVKNSLNDPESAQFTGVKFYRQTGGACGLVNAKNKMGGYVGLTQFSVSPEGDVQFRPNGNTKTGELEDRLAALKEELAFVQLVIANCPEPQKQP